jgi:hypothetical protein
MIMSIKDLRYSKKIGFILAGVLVGVCSGISSVSAAEELGSSRARAGFNRPNFNRPNFNRPAFNRPNVRPNIGQRPLVRPIEVNPVFVEEEEVNVVDPCFVPEVALFIGPECNVVVNDKED